MATCGDCKHWQPKYLDSSEAGWRTKMLIEASFGGCTLVDDHIKTKLLAEPDIEAQIKDGAFILGDFADLITHASFGCNRWQAKLGRKRKANER